MIPSLAFLSPLISSTSFFLYSSSLCFCILSSYTCLFMACYSAILLASCIYFVYLTLFFSLSLASYSSLCFLIYLAFLVSSSSLAFAYSGESFDSLYACPCSLNYYWKSGSYLCYSIHFYALYRSALSEIRVIITCKEESLFWYVLWMTLSHQFISQRLVYQHFDTLALLTPLLGFLLLIGLLVLLEPLGPFLLLFGMIWNPIEQCA